MFGYINKNSFSPKSLGLAMNVSAAEKLELPKKHNVEMSMFSNIKI